MDYITVGCKVSFKDIDSTITFTYEGIPFVIYFRELDDVADDVLKKLNFHVNDDHTICSVYNLRTYGRIGSFFFSRELEAIQEDSDEREARTTRIKSELDNPDLKLTAPSNIFMKFIKDTDASLDSDELQNLYPDEYEQWMTGDRQDSNPVSRIYDKKEELFPSSGGRRKNGRRCRRTRQKTKRVKRAKLMKRSRKANHIKNVKH